MFRTSWCARRYVDVYFASIKYNQYIIRRKKQHEGITKGDARASAKTRWRCYIFGFLCVFHFLEWSVSHLLCSGSFNVAIVSITHSWSEEAWLFGYVRQSRIEKTRRWIARVLHTDFDLINSDLFSSPKPREKEKKERSLPCLFAVFLPFSSWQNTHTQWDDSRIFAFDGEARPMIYEGCFTLRDLAEQRHLFSHRVM